MGTVNDLIVALVTASNDVETLGHHEVARLLDTAIGTIRDLRGQPHTHVEKGTDTLTALEHAASKTAGLTRDDWQRELRHAADILRNLQPTIDPEPALPAHQPDGGDGGNY